AFLDANGATNFTTGDVTNAFGLITASRSPKMSATPAGLSALDRPFLSFATGYSPKDNPGGTRNPQYPAHPSGVNDTLLRAADLTSAENAQPDGGMSQARALE